MTPEEIFFEEKVLIHYNYLGKYLNTLLCDQILAEDILQETMTRALEKVTTLMNYKDLRPALRIMSTNIYINHKKSKKNQELCDEVLLYDKLPTVKDNLLIILDQEDKRIVFDAIGKLKAPCLNIILLRYYYDLPFTTIAQVLGLNYNTVLSHHRRSVNRLKDLLAP